MVAMRHSQTVKLQLENPTGHTTGLRSNDHIKRTTELKDIATVYGAQEVTEGSSGGVL